MKIITLATLRKRSIFIFCEAEPLFEIYSQLIYPHINDVNLCIEKDIALSKPSFFIKDKRDLLLVHNFELYNILKKIDTTDKTLTHEIIFSEINADVFKFELAFYELIQTTSRYHKLAELEQVYDGLNELLTPEMCQKLLGKNSFPIATFCSLINLPERTYYNHIEMN